jgi:hypothetical protein
MAKPFSLNDLMPDDPLQAQGWAACFMWAAGEPQVLKHFREETGNTYEPGETLIARMIDKASGAEAAFTEAFDRFDERVWGELGGEDD